MKKIKEFIARHRKNIIILSSIILFITAITNLFFVTTIQATSNDECLWITKSKVDSVIYFDKVKVDGVTWKAGIRDGDILVAISGVKLINTFQAQNELNKIPAGQYANYTYSRNGNEMEGKVYVKKLINFPNLGIALLGFFWLIVGFMVVMAKPEGHLQRLFFNIGAAFVLFFAVILLGAINNLFPYFGLITDLIWSAAGIFLPFMIIHFFWLFPKPMKMMKKNWVKKTLYIIPTVIFILSVAYRYMFVYWGSKQNIFYPVFTRVLLFAIVGGLISGLISLLINYFRTKDKTERKPLFLIVTSFIFGLASILYTMFIAPVISDTLFNSPEYYTPIIFVSIIPIAFGVSIFRYQLMDVSAVIKNTIVYGAATLTIAALYFFIIYIIGQSVSQAIGTEYQGIIAGIIFILFAMVFQSTKDKFQDFLTAKFYPEQFAYQKVLVKFSNEVPVMVGLDNILDSMQETLVNALMLKQFGIMIKDSENNYILERSARINNSQLYLSKNNLIPFIKQKQKVLAKLVIEQSDFVEVFPDEAEKLKENEIYTVIPMIIKSKIIGLLLFGLKHSGSQFAGKDLELLSAAASQAAISIENARLYRSEAEKFKIERDLDLARKIQQSLLPKCIPNLSGLDICGQMVPAMQVGGDYYDLIPISDTKLFVVVGDVSGKGLSASLYMTKLQTMMQLACVDSRTPKEILIDVNKKLYTTIEKDWFVTMSLALFDTEKGTVKTCRAGHVPLLLASNGTVNSHRTMGIGVGLERGIIFEKALVEEEIPLLPGKIFAFYSDGITEAMNEKEELFGEDKLIELLRHKTAYRSSELMDEIWNSIIKFRGKAEQNDDMTMVLIKVS